MSTRNDAPSARRRRTASAAVAANALAALIAVGAAACPAASHAQLSYTRSWLGNSFGTGQANNGKWVPNNMVDLWVRKSADPGADGTCYTVSKWDEGHHECSIFRNGDKVGTLTDVHVRASLSVTGDERYVYVGMGRHVRRYNFSGSTAGLPGANSPAPELSGSAVPIEAATYQDPAFPNDPTKTISVESQYPGGLVIGLAAYQSGATGRLYVCDRSTTPYKASGEVEIWDTNAAVAGTTNPGMRKLGSVPLARPGRCALDASRNLWVVQQADPATSTPARILCYSTANDQLTLQGARTITFPAPADARDAVDPGALHVDAAGRLLVGDNSRQQRIRVYGLSGTGAPAFLGFYGAAGGILSGTKGQVRLPGASGVAPKLQGPTGLGTDGAGRLYVSQNKFGPLQNGTAGAGSVLEAYTLAGAPANSATGTLAALDWRLIGIEFCDSAAIDKATDAGQVYTKYARYVMNYAAGPGQEGTYSGHLLDQFAFPHDMRYKKRGTNFDFEHVFLVRQLGTGGTRFLFGSSMWGGRLSVYRLGADGEVARPAGMISGAGRLGDAALYDHLATGKPAAGEFIWRDLDGDGQVEAGEFAQPASPSNNEPRALGWFVDAGGDVWQAGKDGLFRYPFQGVSANGVPQWDYASRTQEAAPAPLNNAMRVAYDRTTDQMLLLGFTPAYPAPGGATKAAGRVLVRYDNWSQPTRRKVWERVIFRGTPTSGRSAEDVGATGFALYGDFLFVAYDGCSNTEGTVRVYRLSDGGYAGKFDLPNDGSGRIDIPHGVRAHRRGNGEYVVLAEENWHARIAVYRWTPWTAAPTAFTLNAPTAGTGSVALSWTASANTGGYKVLRSTTGPTGAFSEILYTDGSGNPNAARDLLGTEVVGTGFTDTGLTAGQTYHYKVVAMGPAGDRESNVVSAAAR